MIRFRFNLTPMDQVLPWGEREQDPVLHWFGLTDGWYWIDLGVCELLRYTPETLAGFQRQVELGNGRPRQHPYADYYLARFWEDIALLAPAVSQPVPAGLAAFMASDRTDWPDPDDAPDRSAAADAAASWHDSHTLNLGYLQPSPRIRAWRSVGGGRDVVTVAWRPRGTGDSDIRFTADPAGQVSVPAGSFFSAVRQLDHDLMAAMRQRITELERTGPPAGVQIDMDRLRAEHEERTAWLAARMHEPVTDWAAVQAGAAELMGLVTP